MFANMRGCRTDGIEDITSGMVLERPTEEGESPVHVDYIGEVGILSRAGPEKSRLKQPAPSGKAKYDQETDSEQVP